jgi:hypothetical protein
LSISGCLRKLASPLVNEQEIKRRRFLRYTAEISPAGNDRHKNYARLAVSAHAWGNAQALATSTPLPGINTHFCHFFYDVVFLRTWNRIESVRNCDKLSVKIFKDRKEILCKFSPNGIRMHIASELAVCNKRYEILNFVGKSVRKLPALMWWTDFHRSADFSFIPEMRTQRLRDFQFYLLFFLSQGGSMNVERSLLLATQVLHHARRGGCWRALIFLNQVKRKLREGIRGKENFVKYVS